MTFNDEILQINDQLYFEHLINKDDKHKIEPLESETVLINLGTNENEKMIKVGFTLNKKKKKTRRVDLSLDGIPRSFCTVLQRHARYQP